MAATTIPQPTALSRPLPLQPAERRAMRWLAALALLHGLLYIFLVPPWQHYDEPAQFEYAAQIAAGGLSAAQAADLRREIGDSMYRHRFWPEGVRPDLLEPRGPALGENQRVHPPLYYTLVAGVIAPLRYAPVELQLYAGRLLSLALFALTVLVAWRSVVALAPDEPRAQIALPLLLLLAPAYADLMSALNGDALVNFCAAAMLLGCALLLRDGARPAWLALAILGLAGALLTKRTALAALIPCALAIFWALRRRPLPWWAYLGGLGLAAALAAALTLRVGAGRLAPRPWLAALDDRYLRLDIDRWLVSVFDLERSAPLYPLTVGTIFTSFWARFAWGHIGLGPVVDGALAAVVGLAAAGLGLWAAREGRGLPTWQRRWVWLCLVAVGSAWLATVARLHPLPAGGELYLPRGRYLFWSMLPALWLLALGWQGLMPERWRPAGLYGLVALIALLDLGALAALASFYYLR